MKLRSALLALACLTATAAPALEDPEILARRAAGQLEAAQNALATAERASDRVAALTETIRAYEAGLSALREGLRRAASREATLRARFDAQREKVMAKYGLLDHSQSLSQMAPDESAMATTAPANLASPVATEPAEAPAKESKLWLPD